MTAAMLWAAGTVSALDVRQPVSATAADAPAACSPCALHGVGSTLAHTHPLSGIVVTFVIFVISCRRPSRVPAPYSQLPQQQQGKAAPPATLMQPAESSSSSINAPAATQLPPASPPQVAEVAPKGISSSASAGTQPQPGSRTDGVAAAWPAAANGGYLSPGRKAAGKIVSAGAAAVGGLAVAGSPAVDAQMLPAIGVA
jgi:hypothetical protein